MSNVFVLLFVVSLKSVVYETHTVGVLTDHAAPDVCIICDLDNTLVRPVGLLGSDEWFVDFLKHDDHTMFSEHLRRLIHLFEAVHHRVALVRLEDDAHDILSFCADRGARILGMTARSRRLQERTVEQLRALSIDFSRTSRLFDQDLGNNTSICAGVVFCNGGNKAEAFRKLADAEGYRPSVMIVLDDRREHLEQFGALCQEWGIPCLLYHYCGAERYRKLYTRDHALRELKQFIVEYPEVAECALIICAAFGMVEISHS